MSHSYLEVHELIAVSLRMSCVLRKPTFCICENKDADRLCSYCESDQRLCFHSTDSTIPLFLIQNFKLLSSITTPTLLVFS